MSWDKGDTTLLPRIVPGTTIRVRAPWHNKTRRPSRNGPALRLVETPQETSGANSAKKEGDDK